LLLGNYAPGAPLHYNRHMDSLVVAGRQFRSRLIVGTGKYKSFAETARALEASGAEMVTVAVRRVNLDRSKESLLDYIDPGKYFLLPNTAGCYTADDAIRAARLGREVGLSDWIKLEVIGDERTLYPDVQATLEATRVLVKEGFTVLPYTSDDVVFAKRLLDAGASAVMPLGAPIGSGLGIQNQANIRILRDFYRLGVRYMTLTWANTNEWADSSGDAPKNDGLTAFGREVVLEMNRLGMLVDISHVSDKTFYDVIATSKAPVIASHSSARALDSHPRNMTDDMLRALARNGGVADVDFYPVFLSNEELQASKERDERLKPEIDALRRTDPDEGADYEAEVKKLEDANPLPPVPWTRIVDAIDHMVKVAGIDHVGIGSDFDGIGETPEGMEDVSHLPRIRTELKRRGYSNADIRKIMGENFMRVFAEVERVAGAMQKESPMPPVGNAAR